MNAARMLRWMSAHTGKPLTLGWIARRSQTRKLFGEGGYYKQRHGLASGASMLIECSQYSSSQLYFLLVQTVIPRPIAWVISDNGNGTINLAPFSFFNALASNPPILMISVGWKDDDVRKDTWVNIEERSEFVVHVPSVEEAKEVVGSSASLPHGVSEVDSLHLKLTRVEGWPLPRLASAKVAFHCTKYAIHEIGRDPQGLILGEIKSIWLDDTIVQIKGKHWVIDYQKFNPLARLGGPSYSQLGRIFDIPRPE